MYKMGYYLADGIYPEWQILMKTISNPQTPKQTHMIIVDEQDHPELDQKYLKEKEKGSSFKVSKFQRGTAQDSEMIKKHIATVRKEYMSYTEHQRLKADLLEHLWSMKGEKALLDSDSDSDDDE